MRYTQVQPPKRDESIGISEISTLKRCDQSRSGQQTNTFDFHAALELPQQARFLELFLDLLFDQRFQPLHGTYLALERGFEPRQIGRASLRERVCQYV